MTIYGESDVQFRPRPTTGRMIALSFAITLLSAWLAALVDSIVTLSASQVRLAGETGVPLFLQPAGTSTLPGLHALTEPGRLAAGPLSLVIIAVGLLAFWPSGLSLASRLSLRFVARTLALAAITTSFATSPATWLTGDLSLAGLWRPAVVLIALVLVWRCELSLRRLTSVLFSVALPGNRASLWARLSLPQFAAWALLGLLQGSAAALWAAGLSLVVSAVAITATSRGDAWEKLERPTMTDEPMFAATMAVGVTLGGILLFGAPSLGIPHRVVLLAAKPLVRQVPLAEVQLTTGTAEATSSATDATTSPEGKPNGVIRIEWSDPARQKATKPPAQ